MLTFHPKGWSFDSGKVAALVIAVTIGLTVGGSVINGFVYDDVSAIVENSRAHDPTDLKTIFTSPYWTNTLYRPITTTAFATLWWVGGGNPMPFHLANVALLLGVCLLLHRVVLGLGATPVAALMATLLFAVHPVHVEVVANGVGLAELLSTGFLLAGATLALRRPLQRSTPTLVGLCGLLAFLGKESGITALALIPLLWWCSKDSATESPEVNRRETGLALLGFLGIGLIIRTMVLDSLGGEAPLRALEGINTVTRLQTVLGVVPEWARLLLWPAHLQADYSPPQIPVGGPLSWRHAAGGILLLGWLAALVVSARREARIIAAGLLWIPIALSPVSNILFPTGILLAERTLFLPSVGLGLVAAGVVDGLPRWRPHIVGFSLLMVVLGSIRTHSRADVWRDQQIFSRQLVIDGAEGFRSWYVAAGIAAKTGDALKSRLLLAKAWRLSDGDYRVAEEYGQILRIGGDIKGAVVVFERGFHRSPNREPLTSRLLESLIALERWEEARELIARVEALSAEDAARLAGRLAEARQRRIRPPG